jgi:hypothetical protein
MGPRTGLDDMEKRKLLFIEGFEFRTLGRPARSQSLYRLRYPGSHMRIKYLFLLIMATACHLQKEKPVLQRIILHICFNIIFRSGLLPVL